MRNRKDGHKDVSLYVREAGPADPPAVLFLHGLELSSAMWQAQFERLADYYHCLAPDLPECGNSAAIGPFTLKDAASRVRARGRPVSRRRGRLADAARR